MKQASAHLEPACLECLAHVGVQFHEGADADSQLVVLDLEPAIIDELLHSCNCFLIKS